jgi:DUF4097 and DUF4098 domain-containing protein YvlB
VASHCALALLVLLSPRLANAEADRLSRTLPLPPGRAISVEITIGDVRIDGGPGSDAVIEVVRHAPDAAALTRIPVQIDESESEIRIRALQTENATDPALRTDVTIRVPAAAVVRSVQILEGRLALNELRGSITADVRRGPIEAVKVEGAVRLETGIGDVIATQMRLTPNGLLRLRAFNGDVRLTLAEKPIDARILALALNGSIKSEIPLRMKDTWGPRWGEATLGKGEPVISIDVITGKIEIAVRPGSG